MGTLMEPSSQPGEELLEKKQKPNETELDEIISAIGNDGTFQKRYNWVFNFILVAFLTMPYLNLVLAMSVPKHHCHVPGRNQSVHNLSTWQQKTLPVEVDPKTGVESLSSCRMYFNDSNTETIGCKDGWDYDVTYYSLTIPSMQNWVCDNDLYAANTLVISRIGEIIGTFSFGQLGDRFGRKPIFYTSLTILILGRTLTVFTSFNYYFFMTAVFLGSLSAVSVFQSPGVIGMEISANEKRATIAFMQCVGWVVGTCTLPMISWALGDWRWMIIATTLPCVSAYFIIGWMPESPRWLASAGRIEESLKAISAIATVNGTVVPENAQEVLENIADRKEKVYGIPSLFSSKRMARNTLMNIICNTVCGLSYYSIVLNITNMAGNPFMNFFWQSLVELPGYVVAKYISNKYGRKWTHTCSYFVAIALCTCIILLKGNIAWASLVLVTLLKFTITVAFFIIMLQAMELYPTCVRQTGTSIGGLVSNIFGILGPYIVYLGTAVDWRWPYGIFIGLAFIGALCSAMLPETLNKKLPETLEDAKNL